ncbi:uncharacterized protein LOC144443161 [Glandiceps talaboti]
MAPLAHTIPPASKHSLFMRGFGGQTNKEEIRNFFMKETNSHVTYDFCKTNIEHSKLYVALRFKTKEIARDVYNRFDGKTILGNTIKMSWFRDLRIVKVGKDRYFTPQSVYHSRNIQRLRASVNPFYRRRAVSPKRVLSLRDSRRIRSPSEDRDREKRKSSSTSVRRSDSHSRSLRSPSPKRRSMREYSPTESRHRSQSSHSHERSRSPHRSLRSHSTSKTPERGLRSRSRSRTPEHKRSNSPSPKIVIRNHPNGDKKMPYSSSIYGKVATFNDVHIRTESKVSSSHITNNGSSSSSSSSQESYASKQDTDMRKMHYNMGGDDSRNSYKSSLRIATVTNGSSSRPSDYHSRREPDSHSRSHGSKWTTSTPPPPPPPPSSSSTRQKYVNGNHRTNSREASPEWTPQQLSVLRGKKEEIERAYRQDCETFATVVKMLISKDPELEERIQYSLEENLKEIGHRCVDELKETIEKVKTQRDKP